MSMTVGEQSQATGAALALRWERDAAVCAAYLVSDLWVRDIRCQHDARAQMDRWSVQWVEGGPWEIIARSHLQLIEWCTASDIDVPGVEQALGVDMRAIPADVQAWLDGLACDAKREWCAAWVEWRLASLDGSTDPEPALPAASWARKALKRAETICHKAGIR